ncbi:unnamed protein product [Amoebophrya sp. A25]|nr:unnamed protein product [Amoebophrya sp. A25]|eukprot:GSA25T00002656001.1
MFAVLLICYDDVDMKDLDWRWLIVMGSIPSMMFGIYGMFVLHESPAWLYSQEKIQEAIEVLEWVRGENFRSRATKCGCFFGRGEGVALIEEKFGFYPDDFAPQDVKTPEELDPRSVWRQPIRLRPPSPSRKVAMDVVGQVTSVRGRTASKDQQPDTGVIGTGPNAATSIDLCSLV